MALTSFLIFDMVGSLITSQGSIPTFTRFSPANAESQVNGSWALQPHARHQPRFSSNGAILLERSAINLLTYPVTLSHSSWVKGSNIFIQNDLTQGLDNTYRADRVVVSSYTGNQAANTMTKSLISASSKTYTVTAYLSLAGGQFGANDVFRVTGAVAEAKSVGLASVYNAAPGNYIPITLTFTASGTAASYESDTYRTINIQLYCEKAVSIDWGGIQVEEADHRTSLILQEADPTSRDADFLQYGRSPIAGLPSFVFYANLEYWAGDGNILTAGNFKVEIVGGALKASCGAVEIIDPDPLPAAARITVRVSQGLARCAIYVNGVMKAREDLSNYSATVSQVTIAGAGARKLRCLYLFNRDFSDGSIDVGGSALGEILELNTQDSLLTDLAEGFSRVVFAPVLLRVGRTATVKFPLIQSARQAVSSITPGSGKAAQVETVTVQTIANASASQIDWVIINNTQFTFASDATPTTTEIAAGLAALINASTIPVTASPSAGTFTLTADVAGDDFSLSVSDRLSFANTTPNAVDVNTIAVPAATDYVRGRAYVYRDYAFVAELQILTINTVANTMTVQAVPNSEFAKIATGDIVIQFGWNLRVGEANYFCHHLEDYGDVRPFSKSVDGFTLINNGLVDRVVTPYAKITL